MEVKAGINMKRIIVLCILTLCVTTACFGQTKQTKSLTVSTYYPSPTAVYMNLRLSSTSAPGNATLRPGVIYYDGSLDKIRYYNKTSAWVALPGSGAAGPDYWEYNSSRDELNNTETNGQVIIGEAGAGAEALRVNGEVMVFHKPPLGDGNTILYMSRYNGSNTARVIFNTNSPETDIYRIGISGSPSRLIIDNGTKEFMSVNSAGNMMIGEGNASCRLHVAGNETGVDAAQTLMMTEGDGETQHSFYVASNDSAKGPEIRMYRARGSLNPSSLKYALKNNDTIFEIEGNGWSGAAWQMACKLQLSADGDFSATSSPGRISFFTTPTGSTTPLERMVIKNDGKVGINTADPQYLFQVRIDSSNEGHVVPGTGAWAPASDKRLKKNISGIEDALAKVLHMRGVRYDLITEMPSIEQKGRHFGFVAQQLEKELPELVDADSEGHKGVLYGSVTPILVEAIKAQHNEIESLRKELKALKDLK